MDQNDSYPSRTCSALGHHHSLTAHMHWEELCSCASSTSQSSESLSKSPISHCELYTSEADHLDYPSPVVRLIPASGASGISREPGIDMGQLGGYTYNIYLTLYCYLIGVDTALQKCKIWVLKPNHRVL